MILSKVERSELDLPDEEDLECVCKGGICYQCSGAGIVACPTCSGTGYCHSCGKYRLKWKEATILARSGDAYNAIAQLQRMLEEMDSGGKSNTTTSRTIGAVGGALAGSFIPVIGTLIGATIGGLAGSMIGDAASHDLDKLKSETHYRMGVIYENLRNPSALHHYQQAKLLFIGHEHATEALKRLQPAIAISPQLAALDNDF